MDTYVTGAVIRELREKKNMTQLELAERLSVSDRTISKWETGKGFPDITLLEPLAHALGISLTELLSGNMVTNRNRGSNMLRTPFYVCPVCGNVIHSVGRAVISCCGIDLPPLEAEEPDEEHGIRWEMVEDQIYVTMDHPMEKDHYISFLAGISDNGIQLVKLYPEGECGARFTRSRVRKIVGYCNRHGLFQIRAK